ncbi:MAG: site-specific DNA-methyltransferase [Pseudoalteromonas distincta]
MDKHTPNTLDGASMAISEQRKQELKQLFPGVFTETRNDAGELVETIDFERLKAELGQFSEIYDNRRERYGMDWPGKRDSLRLIQQPSHATLKPCREESVNFDSTENLFIEGDNLEVLKLLQKSYYGQVKMIYIDPPYNTGKEFIYPDNFSESLDTYLQYAGLKDSQGRTFSTNTANEGRFHTKWLNMMFPRLYLARNLLRDDGVIFISIDDNEVENLRRMCDEVFGEENFIANIVWQHSVQPKGYTNIFSVHHNHILLYRRSEEFDVSPLERTDTDNRSYSNPDGDPKGEWRAGDVRNALYRPNLIYSIQTPSGGFIEPPANGWRWSKNTLQRKIETGEVIFSADESRIVRKIYLADQDGRAPETIWLGAKAGTTRDASRELKELFDGAVPFDTPKPTKLISQMIQVAGMKDGDICVDFFSGSGSLGHAAYRHERNINFILVQLPEKVDESLPHGKAAAEMGLETISEVCIQRLARSAIKVRSEDRLGFDRKDLGFKVLKLDESNFKPWRAPDKSISDAELLQQMELSVDHVDPNASQEDLLYELLLKAGVKPTEKIEVVSLAGHQVFAVGEGHLLVHLDNQIDQGLIDAVLQQAPSQFICLDKAFHGNDQLKTNAVRTFANFNDGKVGIERIDFKTV